MKRLATTLITLVLVIAFISPMIASLPSILVVEYAHQAHGDHGLGNVNQFFKGVYPDPWDNPPGLQP